MALFFIMENHPIPQDVTGFKFKLIGSVTVKQFLYILGAGALCGVLFIMPLPFIIKWPLIVTLAGLGAGLAFLPIEGRPMDVMLVNFLKALPAENRFIFHKVGAEALLHDYFTLQQQKPVAQTQPELKNDRRELLLSQLVRKSAPYKADEDERQKINSINSIFSDSNIPVTGMQSLDENEATTPQINPSAVVRPQMPYVKLPVAADSPPETTAQNTVEESASLPEITTQEPSEQAPVEFTPPEPTEQIMPATPAVVVPPEEQVASGFPQIPDTPNIALGIVKDARGRVLPNIIVEVVDEGSSPVRAFKTNALGQFSSATPLPNGKYRIILEDTRGIHEFTPIDIEMTGKIFQPVVIQSTDEREKLRQELFGGTVQTV